MTPYIDPKDRLKKKNELMALLYIAGNGPSYRKRENFRIESQTLTRVEKSFKFRVKSVRPRIKLPDRFEELRNSVESLVNEFEDEKSKLSNYWNLRSTLEILNKEARSFADTYLLRSIVILLDSIRHISPLMLNKKQVVIVKHVADNIFNKEISREKFKELYKLLLDGKFQIIPEPKKQ